MKIIGTTPHGFILEARENEVANLIGAHWAGQAGTRELLKVGATIDAAVLYQHRREFDSIDKTLTQAAGQLRAAAAILDGVPPILKPVPPQPANPVNGEDF